MSYAFRVVYLKMFSNTYIITRSPNELPTFLFNIHVHVHVNKQKNLNQVTPAHPFDRMFLRNRLHVYIPCHQLLYLYIIVPLYV